jgi:hypothetical protein
MPTTNGSASGLPTVSVVIPAYNYEQYVGEAIDSVLAQDYPRGLLEVVVVDDGSQDRTAAVARAYVDRHPQTVRLVQQANSGPEITVGRGMRETSGELLALLDADDAWMPGKLAAQVAVLQDRPEVALVFGDLLPVGPDGEPLPRERLLSQMHPLTRRAGAAILWSNLAFSSTILVRRALVTAPPAEIPIADWWLTGQAALAGEIAWVRDPVVRYRIHGGNRSSGRAGAAGGEANVRPYLRDVRFHLGTLRLFDLHEFAPAELVRLWDGLENRAAAIMNASGSYFADLTDHVELDTARSLGLLEQSHAAGERGAHLDEARLMLEALAWDPYLAEGRARLQAAAARAETAEAGNPLGGARRNVVLADAEELLGDDALLLDYAAVMSGLPDVTLAVDATRLPEEEAATGLTELVSRCGLDQRNDIDVLAVVGERNVIQQYRLHAGATAYYRRPMRTANATTASVEFTPATLPQLRELVLRRAREG